MPVHWCLRPNTKGSDVLSPSRLVVHVEKVKPSVFLLVGARKELYTKTLLGKSREQPANPVYMGKAIKMMCVSDTL